MHTADDYRGPPGRKSSAYTIGAEKIPNSSLFLLSVLSLGEKG
jgi:hypothetical protein